MNIPPRSFKLTVIACAICYANLTYAQDAQVQALQTIQVKASNAEQSSEQTKAYNVKNSSSATKLNIEAKETPQTINVVTRQQIEDFGLTSTRDVLKNTPGVTVSNQETERTTYMARGFEISNILTDGVGFPLSGYNYNNTNPDTYFYDRVEVVKGADSLLMPLAIRVQPSIIFENVQHKNFKQAVVQVTVHGIRSAMKLTYLAQFYQVEKYVAVLWAMNKLVILT